MRVRFIKETDVKKSRFNEAQIIGVLREQEAGSPKPDSGGLPAARDQRADLLQVEGEIQWHECVGRHEAEGAGG